MPLALRVAASLLFLYAHPVTRISRLRVDDVVINDQDVAIRFGAEPASLPRPVADLVLRHLQARPNIATAANADSQWLFPVARPASH